METILLKAKIKHYLARVISLVLLASGLYKISTSLYEIYDLTNTIQTGIIIPHAEFQLFLKKFLIESIEAVIETIYGMILLFTHSHKVKVLHLIVGVSIALLPWLINNQLLQQIEQSIPQAQAQVTSPAQALSDYQYQLQKYREAHQKYLSAKNLYLSFQTLTAKAEAIEATKSLLIHRAGALKSYFFLSRISLNQTPSIPESTRASLHSQLLTQEAFLGSYQQEIPPVTDVAILTTLSQKLESAYPQMQVLGYNVLFAILMGEQQFSTQKLNHYHQDLQKLVEGATESEINQPQALQWLKDIQATLSQNQTSYIQANQIILGIKAKDSAIINNQRDFAKALNELDLAKNRLLQVKGYITEEINLLKYD